MAVVVDVKRSRVRIGQRWFPACTAIMPNVGSRDHPLRDRHFGGISALGRDGGVIEYQWIVPMENGALVVLDEFYYLAPHDHHVLHMYLHSPMVEVIDLNDVDEFVTLHTMCVDNGEIHPFNRFNRYRSDGLWEWQDCEYDWACEHLDRLSTMQVHQPEGQRAELVKLERTVELDQEWMAWIRDAQSRRASA